MLLFLTIALPMLGGAAMGLMRFSSAKSRGIYVETIVLATSILTWVLLLTRTDTTYVLCHMNSELALAFRVDGMSCIFAGLVSILWPLASLYGFEYMQHEERPNTFFSYYTMSYAVTLAVAFSANLFSLYVFYECLTLITLPLVIHKKDTMSIRAGRKYLTFSISGAALAFIALVFIITTARRRTLSSAACWTRKNQRDGRTAEIRVPAGVRRFRHESGCFPNVRMAAGGFCRPDARNSAAARGGGRQRGRVRRPARDLLLFRRVVPLRDVGADGRFAA